MALNADLEGHEAQPGSSLSQAKLFLEERRNHKRMVQECRGRGVGMERVHGWVGL